VFSFLLLSLLCVLSLSTTSYYHPYHTNPTPLSDFISFVLWGVSVLLVSLSPSLFILRNGVVFVFDTLHNKKFFLD